MSGSHTPVSSGPDCEDFKVENEGFDFVNLYHSLNACVSDDSDTLLMDPYLRAYNELYKFFGVLGRAFTFVASDVQNKITILEVYRKSGLSDEYSTIQSMILHEFSEKTSNGSREIVLNSKKKKYNSERPSGSRTLLRLHRALEFVIEFLKVVLTVQPEEKLTYVCRESYKSTLAKHHSWLIQKGALLAMYALPTQGRLIELTWNSNNELNKNAEDIINDVVAKAKDVYDKTQRLYKEHDLLDLE